MKMRELPIGFIGTGNMAGAIIGGVVGKGLLRPEEIGVFDVDGDKLSEYSAQGHRAFGSVRELAQGCRTIVLSIKPQSFDAVLPQLREGVSPGKVVVSIAAGIPAERIKTAVGFDCKVVLAMPNTPLLLGCGATALSRVDPTTPEEFAFVKSLFESAGIAEEIESSLMSEVIPYNGSAPAVVYLLAKLMADSAEEMGIERGKADRLFLQTLMGSTQMMLQSGRSQQELIDMVCSPGGTTLAGLTAMREAGFGEAVRAYCDACVRRAKELAE